MPTLAKIHLTNADGTDFAYVALAASMACGFRFSDGALRNFQQLRVMPLGAVLEPTINAELAALTRGSEFSAQVPTELAHVLRNGLGIHRDRIRAVIRDVLDVPPLTSGVVQSRYLEPWLATSDPHFPAEGDDVPPMTAYVYARQHVTGAWAQTRIAPEDREWTIEFGDQRSRVQDHGNNSAWTFAKEAADKGAHPGCSGPSGGCGEWMPRERNDPEWRRLRLPL